MVFVFKFKKMNPNKVKNIVNGKKLFKVNIEKDQMLKNILKIILALLLIISGASKIFDPERVIELLTVIPLFPRFLIIPTVLLLPGVELSIGSLLLLNIYQKLTAIVAFLLFLSFLSISVYGTVIGINSECGCFGSLIESRIGWKMIVRNSIFLFIAGYICWDENKNLFLKKLVKKY